MSRRRRKTNFGESAFQNNLTYDNYYMRLLNIALSIFDWQNLPDTVDPRYMESALFYTGRAVFFQDEVIGPVALNVAPGGTFNVYGYPEQRRAYSHYASYSKNLTSADSVLIYNNYARTPSAPDILEYACRLWDLDRTITVNARAQKTPTLLIADERERLAVLNAYKELDGNSPVVMSSKNLDLPNCIKVLSTNAPYVADKLQELKTQIWNEALTYLGIANVSVQKRERMITDEVNRMQGGTIAARYSRLQARREAAEQINKMFGLNISVDFRQDLEPPALPDPEGQEGRTDE